VAKTDDARLVAGERVTAVRFGTHAAASNGRRWPPTADANRGCRLASLAMLYALRPQAEPAAVARRAYCPGCCMLRGSFCGWHSVVPLTTAVCRRVAVDVKGCSCIACFQFA